MIELQPVLWRIEPYLQATKVQFACWNRSVRKAKGKKKRQRNRMRSALESTPPWFTMVPYGVQDANFFVIPQLD